MTHTKYTYRGCLIYHNFEGSPFGTDYISVVNPFITINGHNPHCHVKNKRIAEKVVDYFQAIRKHGYTVSKNCNRYVKNKALRLLNYNLKCV